MKKTELIGLEPVFDAIELAALSVYVKNEKPVSLLLLSEAESGRTEALKKFACNSKSIQVMRRFTAHGYQRDLISGKIKLLFENPKILPTTIVYDFNSMFSFKENTIESTIEFINALTEEGLSNESTYAIFPDEMKKYKGARGGIIAAINTLGMFTVGKKMVKAKLYRGGFFSRPLVFSFDVPESVLASVFDSLILQKDTKDFVKNIKIHEFKKRYDIKISEKYGRELYLITQDIKRGYNERLRNFEIKGIRLFKIIRTMTKCSALRDGRDSVNDEDIELMRFLSNWVNLKMNPLQNSYQFYKWRDSCGKKA